MYSKEQLLQTGYFEDNEYFTRYYDHLQATSLQQRIPFHTTVHHIIPRHYYKQNNMPLDNSEDNKTILFFKDHMYAHMLLSGCTKGRNKYWNIYAIFRMSGKDCDPADLDNLQNLTEFQTLYEQAVKHYPNHRKGVKITEETRERMKTAQHNREWDPTKGRTWVHNGTEELMIPPEKIDTYLSQGYQRGRLFKHSDEYKAEQAQRSHERIITDQFREKMRLIASQQVHTPEQNKRHSDQLKEYYKTHTGFWSGKHLTDEAKEKNRYWHQKVWITNGITEIRILRYQYKNGYPEGFYEGRLPSTNTQD